MRTATYVLLLAASGPLLVASDFAGTWKRDDSKTKLSPPPTVRIEKIAAGWRVHWSTGADYEIVTDGYEHPFAQPGLFETATYRLVDARTLEQDGRRDHKSVGKIVWTASADGKEIHQVTEGVDRRGLRYHNESWMKRAGGAPGADPFSGTWEGGPVHTAVPVTYTISDEAGGIRSQASTGATYAAKFDGKAYPVTGTAENLTVTLARPDEHTIREVFRRKDGSVSRTSTMTVSGARLTEVVNIAPAGGSAQTSTMVFDRQ